jgi:acetyltransferase-like isoleucine patch superfamily enzyme
MCINLANGVKTGGSSIINEYNFLGSGVIISPGVKLSSKNIIIGSGATVTKDITNSGVYVGTPAKKIKESIGKLSGIPEWKNNS